MARRTGLGKPGATPVTQDRWAGIVKFLRNTDWNCSAFADWLRGTPKPKGATANGWRDWHHNAMVKHPWRYWWAEKGLTTAQAIINAPIEGLFRWTYRFNLRFVRQSHLLRTGLPDRIPWMYAASPESAPALPVSVGK